MPLVSYKVNEIAVSVEEYLGSPSNIYFIHVPAAGNLQEHYVFTAQSADGTFLGFPFLTANFSTSAYTMPRRHIATLQEFKKYLRSDPELVTDVTEIRTQRPTEKQVLTDRYSGKKSHTVKSLLLTNLQK